MARCSRLVIFYFKEKFCVLPRIGEMFVLKTLWEKHNFFLPLAPPLARALFLGCTVVDVCIVSFFYHLC